MACIFVDDAHERTTTFYSHTAIPALCRRARRGDLRQVRAKVIRDREVGIGLALQPAAKEHRAVGCAEVGDALLDLGAEVAHEALDGPRGGVAERADRAAFDLLGEFEEHVDLALVAPALDEAVHHVHHPGRAFATGRALAAGLVLVELEHGSG